MKLSRVGASAAMTAIAALALAGCGSSTPEASEPGATSGT